MFYDWNSFSNDSIIFHLYSWISAVEMKLCNMNPSVCMSTASLIIIGATLVCPSAIFATPSSKHKDLISLYSSDRKSKDRSSADTNAADVVESTSSNIPTQQSRNFVDVQKTFERETDEKEKRPFNAWGGKRNFSPWGGKRMINSVYVVKQPGILGGRSSLWKRPRFQPWGGKRKELEKITDFTSEKELDRRAFAPWGGKRSAFAPWGGKRTALENKNDRRNAAGLENKRKFNPWGGKRSAFAPWGGKRSAFAPWGGKRGLSANELATKEVVNENLEGKTVNDTI